VLRVFEEIHFLCQLYDGVVFLCFAVQNSPRLGSLSEIYAEIVILAHGYPNGILQMSNRSVAVPDGYAGPLVYVVRTDGLLGRVRFTLYIDSLN